MHVPITVGGSVVTINQVVIQKGLDKQVILYCTMIEVG